MQSLDEEFSFMINGRAHVSRKHEGDKLFVFERGSLLWIFNFHPTKVLDLLVTPSTGYRLLVPALLVYQSWLCNYSFSGPNLFLEGARYIIICSNQAQNIILILVHHL